jgi:hypothetical protein
MRFRHDRYVPVRITGWIGGPGCSGFAVSLLAEGEFGYAEWRELYREALLESDPTRVPILVEEAYKAVQRRALELWYACSSETKERHELDAALYFLGLLRMVRPMKMGVSHVSDVVRETYDS